MDPAEVRRRNLLPAFTEPLTDQGRRDLRLRRLPGGAGDGARRGRLRRAARRAAARAASAATPCSSASGCRSTSRSPAAAASPAPPNENATVEVHPDGSATILTGTSPHGQGHATVWAMLASDETGIPIDRITVQVGRHRPGPRGRRHRRLAQPAAGRRRGAAGHPGAGRAGQGAAPPTGSRSSADDLVVDTDLAGVAVRGVPGCGRQLRRPRRRARAQGAQRLQRARRDVPVRRARRRRRGRRRDRQGRAGEARRARRRRHGDQPAARRGAAARRAGPGRGAGAARGGALRRGRQPDDEHARVLPDRVGDRAAELRARRPPRRRRRTTRWAPRASARPARSARPRRCRTRWSTPSRISACGTSTCRPPRCGCGGDQRREPRGTADAGRRSPSTASARTDDVEPRLLLVHYLRDVCGLRATNIGCDTTSCGACTVHVDGEAVKSCTVLTVAADGAAVTTLEGLAPSAGRAAPGAARVPRRARPAVRLLHARHGDGRRRAARDAIRDLTEDEVRAGSRATSAGAPATTTSCAPSSPRRATQEATA